MDISPEYWIQYLVNPLFGASDEAGLIARMTIGTFIYAVVVLFLPWPAGYGRYSTNKSGLNPNIAWCLQECPSFFIPVILIFYGKKSAYTSVTNQLFLGMFVMHYFQRSFIFPLLSVFSKKSPWHTFILAFLTCCYNGVLHGLYFTNYHHYKDEVWMKMPNMWIGMIIFLLGMKINIGADSQLRKLKKNTRTYDIPKGGLFEYVSCANYLGEIVEMWGYAIASLSPPAIGHAIFTTFFLSRRALQHHQWYLKKFENYPKTRKALFPYIY